jgi:hypothetical protein
VALVLEKTADVLAETNRVPEAVESARRSLAIFREIADANPTDFAAEISVPISHLKLGDILGNPNFVNAGDEAGALENYRAALEIFESLQISDPANAKVRRFIGVMHERMGAMHALRNDPRPRSRSTRNRLRSACRSPRSRLTTQTSHATPRSRTRSSAPP